MLGLLKTTKFKDIFNLSSRWPLWARHLLLGLLVAVEEWWINKKVVQTVDKAIKEVEPYLPSGVSTPKAPQRATPGAYTLV
jgi:hypothetical protein